jgi:hypothetical protein
MALAMPGLTAQRPNFSGEWKLDLKKSDFGPVPPPESLIRKVEIEGSAMRVTDTQKGGPQGDHIVGRVYSTDGRPTRNVLMGVELQTVTAWKNSTLVMTSKADVGGILVMAEDRWVLSRDGTVLTDEVHVAMPQGEYYMTWVLEKR